MINKSRGFEFLTDKIKRSFPRSASLDVMIENIDMLVTNIR